MNADVYLHYLFYFLICNFWILNVHVPVIKVEIVAFFPNWPSHFASLHILHLIVSPSVAQSVFSIDLIMTVPLLSQLSQVVIFFFFLKYCFFSGVGNCLIFCLLSSMYLSLIFPIFPKEWNKTSSDYIFYMFTHITCPVHSLFFLVPSLHKAPCVGPGPSRSNIPRWD